MKISIFILLALLSCSLLTPACRHEESAKSKHEKDSLLSVINDRESAINDFVASFNEVERNLDSVTAKQKIIYLNVNKSGELKPSQRERINAEINAINKVMEENRLTIARLNNKVKNSFIKNVQLENTIVTLNNQLTQKFLDLATLNEELYFLNLQVEKLQTSIDTLFMQNLEQFQTIARKNIALHTAYYIIGQSKELQEAKLIDKQGGLLGIGRTAKLSSTLDKTKFTQIDYTKTSNIPINSRNPKIITSHPGDSYVLNKEIKDNLQTTDLVITNPEKFWGASKYLVIVNN